MYDFNRIESYNDEDSFTGSEFRRARIELSGERIVNLMTVANSIPKGELYTFWGVNDRLYLSGKGFNTNQILMKRIGDRLLIKI